MDFAVVFRGTHKVSAGLIERNRVEGGKNADVTHLRVGRRGIAVAVHGKVVSHADVEDVVPARSATALAASAIVSRKSSCEGLPQLVVLVPAECIQHFPLDEAMPMEMFFIAPPNPAIA